MRRSLLFASAVLLSAANFASAAPIFSSVNGVFFDERNPDPYSPFPLTGSLTGTIEIDHDLGRVGAADLTVMLFGETAVFTGVPNSQGPEPASSTLEDPSATPQEYFALFRNGQVVLYLDFYGLTPYTSGELVNADNIIPMSLFYDLATGNEALVAEANLTPTPEPSTLALLGSGLFGGLSLARRRLAGRSAW